MNTPHLPKRKRQRLEGRVRAIARQNEGKTGTNPSVGCVLLDKDFVTLAQGVTGLGGRPHAEEAALIALEEAGRLRELEGGIAIVSLEPCRERSAGTPSCSARLIEAGVAQVYALEIDPHPLGRGGINALRDADIKVFTRSDTEPDTK